MESEATVNNWIATYNATYPVARDSTGATFDAYDIYYIPHSFLIDKKREYSLGSRQSRQFQQL
jgi:hypothetical protein